MKLKSIIALLSLAITSSCAFSPRPKAIRDEMRLLDVQGDDHFEIYHPEFTDHRIRIKETTGWCDPDVQSYTGYLDVDSHGRNLFFYFFLSRSDPEKDDVLMWINVSPPAAPVFSLCRDTQPCLLFLGRTRVWF